jgi:hypothetical protein
MRWHRRMNVQMETLLTTLDPLPVPEFYQRILADGLVEFDGCLLLRSRVTDGPTKRISDAEKSHFEGATNAVKLRRPRSMSLHDAARGGIASLEALKRLLEGTPFAGPVVVELNVNQWEADASGIILESDNDVDIRFYRRREGEWSLWDDDLNRFEHEALLQDVSANDASALQV